MPPSLPLHSTRVLNMSSLQGRAKKVVQAQNLWYAILQAQIETGNPYMLYKDACNRKSNQQNLGTIKSSNTSRKNKKSNESLKKKSQNPVAENAMKTQCTLDSVYVSADKIPRFKNDMELYLVGFRFYMC